MKVYGVFEKGGDIMARDPWGPDDLQSLWATRELAEAEVARIVAQHGYTDIIVKELEVYEEVQPNG